MLSELFISGAGIGGLTLALTIGRYSQVAIDLYEAQAEITTVGAGITVWKRTREIMEELDLYSGLAKLTTRPPEDSNGTLDFFLL